MMPFTPGRPLTEAKAALFKSMAHPARIRILELLSESEHTVGELAAESNLELSLLSQHLTVLRRAGIVRSRRERTTVYCSLVDPQMADLLAVARRILGYSLRKDQVVLTALQRTNDAITKADQALGPGGSTMVTQR
jgi:ArsR family transcriptional regulator